jgi:hypothetical protein
LPIAKGFAVRARTANPFAIGNGGILTGAVEAQSLTAGGTSGSYAFSNSGTSSAGSVVSLAGSGSSFASSGTIPPGGIGAISTTKVTAPTISLLSGGIYQPDLDPSRPVSGGVVAGDLLALAASQSLSVAATTVAANVVTSQPGQVATTGQVWTLQSPETFAASSFTPRNTGAVSYSLGTSTTDTAGDTTLVLSYAIDTRPWAAPGAPQAAQAVRTNVNHDRFGGYVSDLLPVPGDPAAIGFVGEVSTHLLNLPDVAAPVDAYDSFIADQALAVPDATLLSGLRLARFIDGCAPATPGRSLRSSSSATATAAAPGCASSARTCAAIRQGTARSMTNT